MASAKKDKLILQKNEILDDKTHPYHSRMDTRERRAAIEEMLKLNQQIVNEE